MDRHDQTHNDIKPQNFLVKFKNGPNDLTQIEIVLTDFGLAGSESQGGTPVFASPECFEKKEKKSDIFSFGRVILFLVLTKQQFAKCLFCPIKTLVRPGTTFIIDLVAKMTSVTNRIDLHLARMLFNELKRSSRILPSKIQIKLLTLIVNDNLTSDYGVYINELCDLRYIFFLQTLSLIFKTIIFQ